MPVARGRGRLPLAVPARVKSVPEAGRRARMTRAPVSARKRMEVSLRFQARPLTCPRHTAVAGRALPASTADEKVESALQEVPLPATEKIKPLAELT